MPCRPYIANDFAVLYAIEEVCFQPPFRFGRGYMRHLVNASNTATWIAEEKGRMAGFAIVEWTRRRGGISAYIQTIEVAPEHRGHGLGSELMRHVEESARAAEAAAIWLHVDAQNAGAIRLYELNGYRCVGREENYYAASPAGLLYVKQLQAEPLAS